MCACSWVHIETTTCLVRFIIGVPLCSHRSHHTRSVPILMTAVAALTCLDPRAGTPLDGPQRGSLEVGQEDTQYQRWPWRSHRRSQSRRRQANMWKYPCCRKRYWKDNRCTTCGSPRDQSARTWTLRWAKQAWAKKSLVLAGRSLAATQQREKEAREELCLTDKAASGARQSAKQDTLLFDDAVPHQQQLPRLTVTAFFRMSDAISKTRGSQSQPKDTSETHPPGLTRTITQGSERL